MGRVLMQKVAKELLGMLSWPGIAARLASAEGALGALSSECGVAVHAPQGIASDCWVQRGAAADMDKLLVCLCCQARCVCMHACKQRLMVCACVRLCPGGNLAAVHNLAAASAGGSNSSSTAAGDTTASASAAGGGQLDREVLRRMMQVGATVTGLGLSLFMLCAAFHGQTSIVA